MRWRLLSTPPMDGAANMALDVWLMQRAHATGEAVLRTYRWAQPTLSIGRHQTARDGYDPAALLRRGVGAVRRPTGGRAILHWRELTYSVTAPARRLSSLREDYARINRVLLRALAALGVPAEIMDNAGATPQPDLQPCFARPATGEIVLRRRSGTSKLIGSAQYRENGALLQHGSILLHDDQPLLLELTGQSVSRTHAVSLSAALEREVSAQEVEESLAGAARALLDPDAMVLEPDGLLEAAREIEAMFRDPLWTWRR